MSYRPVQIIAVLATACALAQADETLYRYEGDIHLLDPSTGWVIGNACEPPCSDSVEDGHFVVRFAGSGDLASYHFWVAQPPDPPPSTLWVEWRFRSNHPLGPNFYTCDARFTTRYDRMITHVYTYGDTAISASGDYGITGLAIDEFHTYRFESSNGTDCRITVDGEVFVWVCSNVQNDGYNYLQARGRGGCDGFPNTVNEWDYVRYGTLSSGELIIATDPPTGYLDPVYFVGMDRFTVTFDAANYVYIDDITVEVTGGIAPVVIQTRRRENDEPDTVEIVLDRPIPLNHTTTFTIDDGTTVNVVEYTLDQAPSNIPVPTVSFWGLLTLATCLATAATIVLRGRSTPASACSSP